MPEKPRRRNVHKRTPKFPKFLREAGGRFKVKRVKETLKSREVMPELLEEVKGRAPLNMLRFLREVVLEMIKKGELFTRKTKHARIVYSAKYADLVRAPILRFRRRVEPIVIRGQVTPDGTVARHTVYKVLIRGTPFARKTYLDVDFRAHVATYEAASLIEAARRGIPVVEFARLVTLPKSNLAVLYTRIPEGYKTLAHSPFSPSTEPRKFLEKLGKLVGSMHKKGFFHGDLDAENILWNMRPENPDFILLDLEGSRFFDKQPAFNQVQGDVGVLAESLCNPSRGLAPFVRNDFIKYFVEAYCRETGYSKEDVMSVIESAAPSQPLQDLRDDMRKRLLRRLGLE